MSLSMAFNLEKATLRHSLEAIQRGGANISLAIDEKGTFVGIVTDGDIRRALLAGAALDSPIEPYIQQNPLTVGPDESRTYVLDLMQARGMSQLPVVSGVGQLLGLHTLREVLGQVPKPNVALILAGGRGSRLLPVTSAIPKPMIEVAGRPILERIVTHCVGYGINRIVLSVGYLSKTIENHFKTGERFGCEISYIHEDPDYPLGTGGPLAKLIDVFPDIEDPVLVVNGDLVTQFNVAAILESHSRSMAVATVGVVSYTHEVPYGVVEVDQSGFLRTLSEKPVIEKRVSAGIYVVEPSLINQIPRGNFIPITKILTDCILRGDSVAVWNCNSEWSDVGRPHDLARVRGDA
jgi:dTDP-glucose pyrophosphorylase